MARILIEDALRLDLSHPAVRRIVGARQMRCGAFEWGGADGAAAARVGFSWRPLARALELRFSIGGAGVTQLIQLTSTSPRFGGIRVWFQCPVTLMRTRALFLPPGRRRWAGRVAHQLTYASQQVRPSVFTRFARDVDRDEAADRRNRVRSLRRLERAAEARRD
jgi:hypothetical protein